MPREIITLQCGECKERNYSTTKNRKTMTERLELEKFCNRCRKHTPHKEVKQIDGLLIFGLTNFKFDNSQIVQFGNESRGVSSTVKLSVSKTELGGSNPSAPAIF